MDYSMRFVDFLEIWGSSDTQDALATSLVRFFWHIWGAFFCTRRRPILCCYLGFICRSLAS